MKQTKLVLLPLCTALLVPTNGDSTALSYTFYDLDIPGFKGILPYAVGLTVYYLTEGAPQNDEYEWNLVFRSGFDRHHETADIIALSSSNITSNGSGKTSAYTTVSKFLLESRLQIRANNKTGTSGVRTAKISAVLAVETIGM